MSLIEPRHCAAFLHGRGISLMEYSNGKNCKRLSRKRRGGRETKTWAGKNTMKFLGKNMINLLYIERKLIRTEKMGKKPRN